MASTLPAFSQRLALILGSLRAVLAAAWGREPAQVALLLLAWPYLQRLEARFISLVARITSGRFVVAAPRPATSTLRERGSRQSLPHRFGWMIQLAPGTRPLASQIRHLLTDPEFAALLAAAPQSGRILRPLCRMLGIAPGTDVPPALHTVPRRSPAGEIALVALPAAPSTPPISDARSPNAEASSARAPPHPVPA